MDNDRFDALIRRLADTRSRRGALVGLAGGALGLLGLTEASAKKNHRRHKHKKKHGGASPPGSPPPGPSTSCADGIKNGAESDVDCGGGTCARCQGGQICNTRDDCHTALCTAGTCQSCAAPADCGLDSNGNGCFCRDNLARPGEKMCTRQTCHLFPGGTCANCAAGEQCAPAGPGAVECCAPCGSPL